MNDRSPLLRALSTIATPPPSVARFDHRAFRGAIAQRDETSPRALDLVPDFFETSPHVDRDVFAPWRLTYYFDLAARPRAQVIAAVHRRLLALAEGFACPLPDGLRAWLSAPAWTDESMLQVVLGLDARHDPKDTRLKYYVILKGDASRLVAGLCEALAVTPPARAKLSQTHIVGLDLTRAGLRDVKLYYALNPDKAARTLRDPRPHARLLRGCRTVVYQHSLIVEHKRSMHFHARAPEVLLRELAGLRRAAPWSQQLVTHLTALNGPGRPPLRPWILAHPWRDGALDRSRASLYLHLSPP